MNRFLIYSFILILSISCKYMRKPDDPDCLTLFSGESYCPETFKIYSQNVQDSFKIFISLPVDYEMPDLNFPVVYLLDANVTFDIVNIIMKTFSYSGLQDQAILVGVGYSDPIALDTLRERDLTYPALPEIPGSGGAPEFYSFLDEELIPEINNRYRTIPGENTIAGHSLGGYFVMYSLLYGTQKNNLAFRNYVSGSPDFSYGNNYLINLENELSDSVFSLPARVFLAAGTIEESDSIFLVFCNQFREHDYRACDIQAYLLNGYDHMDALVPTLSKGLRFALDHRAE